MMKHLVHMLPRACFSSQKYPCVRMECLRPNEKCTRPKELRKGTIGRDRMLLQNSGTRLGVEWSGNWQIAYQHESPDHSISVWNIVARRSSKIERVRGEGGSECAKHGWFSRIQRNRIVQTISFLYVSIGISIYKIFLLIFYHLENYCLALFPQNIIIIFWIYIFIRSNNFSIKINMIYLNLKNNRKQIYIIIKYC